ncbi:hypothetical protein N9J88_03255 [Porticoccaceae bacterium]|nr:hypothetical protein [Porticoccaceae bacterium]
MTTSNDTINRIISELIEREGGFVDHAHDLGGPTMYGITEAVAIANGWHLPIEDLTLDVARDIYIDQYVTNPGLDRVLARSTRVTAELVDTGVNMGVTTAIKFLQRALNALNKNRSLYPDIKADGYLGNQTLAALIAYLRHRGAEGEEVLLKALNCLQGARYIELSEAREANESFTYGWLRERVVI